MRMSAFARLYLRERAGELLTDACIVTRPGPSRVQYDPVTRKATNAASTVLYEGPCRLWEVPTSGPTPYLEGEVIIHTMYLSLPHDAPVPEPEDQIKITAHETDTTLIGRSVQVISVVRGGNLRATRRLLVQLTDTRSEQW